MNEPARRPARRAAPTTWRRLARRRALARSTAIAGAAAVLIMGGLWIQMAAGNDPALAPKRQAAAADPKADRTAGQSASASTPATAPSSQPVIVIGPDGTATLMDGSSATTQVPAPAPAPLQTATS